MFTHPGLPHQSVGVTVTQSFHDPLNCGSHLLRIRITSVYNLQHRAHNSTALSNINTSSSSWIMCWKKVLQLDKNLLLPNGMVQRKLTRHEEIRSLIWEAWPITDHRVWDFPGFKVWVVTLNRWWHVGYRCQRFYRLPNSKDKLNLHWFLLRYFRFFICFDEPSGNKSK